MNIAVLTPALPSRGDMLVEAIASVRAQTLAPTAHLVGIDHARIGIGRMLNQLADAAEAEWLARLDDDDLLDPNHLEALASVAGEADIVYSWCRIAPRNSGPVEPAYPSVIGSSGWVPNQTFDADRLRASNYIPATTLLRKSLWHELGGWHLAGYGVGDSPPSPDGTEDWDFWLRSLDAGARFVCLPEVTWTYRYHGENLWFR
jgi:hypothetical protein